jgi:hypothetical protein
MKSIIKLSIITILFMACLSLSAQQYKNSILLTYSPQDNGIGLRYDHMIKNYGLYISSSYGNYNGYDMNDQYYRIEDHIKLAVGGMIKSNSSPTYFLLGLSYHKYGNMLLTPGINKDAFMPLSIEFGVSADINQVKAGFRMDPIKWERCFEIGLNF